MATNFATRLDATARRFGDKAALISRDGSLTYRELDRRAQAFAAFLARKGVAAGDRIALSTPNQWTSVVALVGALKYGVTATPLNPLLTPDERAQIISDLQPALVIEEIGLGTGSWETLDTPEGPALILYTSGSTGRPKGAVLSHRALTWANQSWAGPVMALTSEDVVVAALPLAHSFGLNGALLAPLMAGASVVLVERFSPEAVLEAIAANRVTVFPGVATMFRRLLDTPALPHADLGNLRLALSGAAPCPWDLAEEWRSRIRVRILRGYGMTELFRPISYLAGDPRELSEAIGRPVPGVAVRIVDDGGGPLPAGAAGELWIKTPAAMDGYLNAPAETQAVFADGWFKTGDLAVMMSEGYVAITGRKRDLILRGGYSIAPAEVEAVLLIHPDVAEAAVVGQPDAELGEEITAFVALRPGARATSEELVAHCKTRLAAFKCPRCIAILPELPKSATGKILKSLLARLR